SAAGVMPTATDAVAATLALGTAIRSTGPCDDGFGTRVNGARRGSIEIGRKQTATRANHDSPADRAVEARGRLVDLQSFRQIELEAGATLRYPQPEQSVLQERTHHVLRQSCQAVTFGSAVTEQRCKFLETREYLLYG